MTYGSMKEDYGHTEKTTVGLYKYISTPAEFYKATKNDGDKSETSDRL